MTAPITLARLAEVTDLQAWPGVTIDDAETTSAEAVLDAVSAYIRLESNNPNRWPATADVPAAIKTLAVVVAARVWRNPDVATRIDVGPFTEMFSKTVDDALYLSATDRAVIAKTIARPRVWTLATCRGEDYLDTVLVPVNGYTDPFPLDAWGNDPSGGGVDFGW